MNRTARKKIPNMKNKWIGNIFHDKRGAMGPRWLLPLGDKTFFIIGFEPKSCDGLNNEPQKRSKRLTRNFTGDCQDIQILFFRNRCTPYINK